MHKNRIVMMVVALMLYACGPMGAETVKTVLDVSRMTCGVVGPICRVVNASCGLLSATSGGDVPVDPMETPDEAVESIAEE